MKIISCRFSCSGPDFVYHQYGICRMYSEKNPQYFRFHVPCLYPWKWIMLLLSSEASFKPGGSLPWQLTSENLSQVFILCSPSFAYEGSLYTIFSTIFSVGIIGIYGVASRTCYPHFHELLLIRIQFFKRIPSLKALNEMCSMNDMPSICILLTFAPNSTDFVSLPLTMGRT